MLLVKGGDSEERHIKAKMLEWTVKVKTASWDVVDFARGPYEHLSYGFLAKSTTLKFIADGPLVHDIVAELVGAA
ncbi:hypothetical protein Poly41_11800 [Novipirellula artificiosorum]|uniref:Uncharacterized protein n=1 Tax=Novipirellula artificiosorum TaxID=2528016 RepID=A0A5C6E6R3_9BACT|nr:hypothetical protein Poly41_11800 [Novipirellula artificiosorum]